ncbi:MAG: class I SAM-dependent methyltransferase [Verrucomicrobiales bacterium]|nr:class I SAM-dependent methyltransferase [Verrucomicrobiales bacterium]
MASPSIVRERVLGWARPIHRKLRGRKVARFLDLAGNERPGQLLDIGGGVGIDGEFRPVYERFAAVTVINLEPKTLDDDGTQDYRLVLGDGCQLPFSARSFDWVFSNAVIEHVGGWERQKRFAEEIRRVASKGYFVTTPDKYFPIEPHTLCPCYQFLPVAAQKRFVRYTPGYLTQYEEINLLSSKQLRILFPEAEIQRVGFPVWGNSLVALCRFS